MCVACFDLWFALTLAQTSIQIRILKQVLAAERQRQAALEAAQGD